MPVPRTGNFGTSREFVYNGITIGQGDSRALQDDFVFGLLLELGGAIPNQVGLIFSTQTAEVAARDPDSE